MEVVLVAQDVCALVVEVEKRLQVLEVVGAAQCLDRRIWERDVVLACQLEDHLGLERALDVQVQLGFGEASDEGLDVGG